MSFETNFQAIYRLTARPATRVEKNELGNGRPRVDRVTDYLADESLFGVVTDLGTLAARLGRRRNSKDVERSTIVEQYALMCLMNTGRRDTQVWQLRERGRRERPPLP